MKTIKFRYATKFDGIFEWHIIDFNDKKLRAKIEAWESVGNPPLQQFTGLYDKNGGECYDKDYDADGNMITWCDECCGWNFAGIDIPTKDVVIKCHNCEGNFMLRDHTPDFEIIGNIYESDNTPQTK